MTFKPGVDPYDLQFLHPAVWILLTAAILYCEEHDLPFIITSLINDREGVEAKSRTHEEGRAIDISVRGWSESQIHRFCHKMTTNYRDIAAISASDLEPRAALYHDNHIHLQVRPNANCNKFV